jgi:hypothetical protein
VKATLVGLLAGLACCAASVAEAGESAFKVLKLEGNAVHWRTAAVPRRVISYSVVTQEVGFSGARNCHKMTRLDELLSSSEISLTAAHAEVAAAFAMWQAVADINFREADSPEQADILIGAQVVPTGWAFADVFYNTMSPDAVKPISKALICLNPARRWKIGFDGDLQRYDLRYTLAHEIGHAIGLDHPAGTGQIMGYRYDEAFRELQPGDIAGAVQIYGTRPTEAVIADMQAPAARVRPVSPVRLYAKRWGTRAFTARSP